MSRAQPERPSGSGPRRGSVALLIVLGLLAAACAGTDASSDPAPGTDVAPASAETVPPPGLPEVPTVTVFGDSTALMSSWGLLTELTRTGRGQFVEGFTGLGCAVLRTPSRRIAGEVARSDPTCNDWGTIWKQRVEAGGPDIVVVQTGSWDVADRQLPNDAAWRSPGDPAFDAFARSELLAAVDLLAAGGAPIVWLTSPEPGAAAYEEERVRLFDPAPRHRRLNEIIAELPGLRPGQVEVVDLAGWVADLEPGEDRRLRPDGVHFSHDSSVEVCDRFLCAEVLRAARRLRPGEATASATTVPPATTVVGPDAPDARERARTALLGKPLYDAGIAASAAGWRLRVDVRETFERQPASDDELVLWWYTGVVNDVR